MKIYNLSRNNSLRFLLAGFVSLLFLIGATGAAAGGGELDASFVPSLIRENQAIGYSVLIQPDGKVLYAGFFLNANLQPRSYIARFNSDGTLDSTFDSGGTFNVDAAINAMALQPDGKIIVAGSFDKIADQTRYSVARLNADGSFDSTFSVPFPARVSSVTSVAIQTDGKILLGGNFSAIGGQSRDGFARVNANGSLDTTFNTTCSAFSNRAIVLQPDGKILVGSTCSTPSSPGVSRLNTNGTLDTSFNAGTGANGAAVRTIALQSDGKVLIGGQFSSFNGQSIAGIVRVNADGTTDAAFVPATNFSTNAIAVQTDGKIIIARDFSFAGSNPVFRLNTNGTNDSSFNANETQVNDINAIAVAADGKIYEAGKMIIDGANFSTVSKPFLRLNAGGTIDASFDPYILYPNLAFGIKSVVVQPDGKILVAGEFSSVNRQARSALVRFNADGTLDTTFTLDANAGIFNGTVNTLVLQPDGKILIGSSLPTADNNRIQRLNADGSRDTTFNVPVDSNGDVKYIALQPDGRILVAGTFTTIGGQTRNSHFARLNADGSVDVFNPTFNGQNYVSSLLVQPDGKFVIGGDFTTVNGVNRGTSARFNADGTLDSTFVNTDFGFSIANYAAILPDGKFLLLTPGSLRRFNSNNTEDATFTPTTFRVTGGNNGAILTVAVQANGKILVGGRFDYSIANTFTPRLNFARLNPDGTLDFSFGNYGGASGGQVNKIALQADGKILIGGSFRMVNNYGHSGLARLNPAVFQTNRISDFDGDGRADASVFRNGDWFVNPSGGNQRFAPNAAYGVQFGLGTDKLAPADYDGDGKTDIAVWRAGEFAYFYILQSATNTVRTEQFGQTGDVVTVGDWDGDGKADSSVYRAAQTAGGQSYFYYRPSTQPNVNFVPIIWGSAGDEAVRGDFDGDGKLDAVIYRPLDNVWYIRQSSNSQTRYAQWGLSTDKRVSGDFDGDGKTDLAIYRNGLWAILQSSNNQQRYESFGQSGDVPATGDYDGDGRTDLAVFRSGVFYIKQSASSQASAQSFGQTGDVPVASAFVR